MDQMARKAGMLIAVSEKLYMSELANRKFDTQGNVKSPGSAIFLEREDEIFKCYKLSWLVETEGVQEIYRDKEYEAGSFNLALRRAKWIIDWHNGMREKQRKEDKEKYQRLYKSWKKRRGTQDSEYT
jgi:hypothetical protein